MGFLLEEPTTEVHDDNETDLEMTTPLLIVEEHQKSNVNINTRSESSSDLKPRSRSVVRFTEPVLPVSPLMSPTESASSPSMFYCISIYGIQLLFCCLPRNKQKQPTNSVKYSARCSVLYVSIAMTLPSRYSAVTLFVKFTSQSCQLSYIILIPELLNLIVRSVENDVSLIQLVM